MSNAVSVLPDSSSSYKITRSILNNKDYTQRKNDRRHPLELEESNNNSTDESRQLTTHQNSCVLFPQVHYYIFKDNH